jgi:hypothetical protein
MDLKFGSFLLNRQKLLLLLLLLLLLKQRQREPCGKKDRQKTWGTTPQKR